MLNFGMFRQSFAMSLQNIRANKLRSFLTMLGIVIGVASVIALITIVGGVTDSIMGTFGDMGAGTLTVNVYGTGMKSGLSDSDLQTLAAIDGVDGIAPSSSLTTTAAYGGKVYDKVMVDGQNAIFFVHNNIIAEGRGLTQADIDGNSLVCIVDKTFMDKVLYGSRAIGQVVRIGGYDYTVVGVKGESNSLSGMFTDTSSFDGTVIVPYRNAMRMSGQKDVTSLELYMIEGADAAAVERRVRAALSNIFNKAKSSYMVVNAKSLMDAMGQIKGMMSTMLGGIASIALLVGGIGIMNMMLVSVSERTKEIGLRKALGAEPNRIQAQFLIESVVLSVLGGLIGVLFGELIALGASAALKTTFTISYRAIALGVGFSVAVGVIFGWAPARRASRLNPIDALRAD
ncbi:ABC transporter permease [Lachnoclostridium sp. Marseille-P6806]|uniref:ABC transporter permease n=1 Tax=Lachnoclostridium sp. Marseille-P6806 TaxID=2364793 RepID=UPI001F5FE11D|nr:ABC transporter permease [Lachnoclostridium sp. Marseille-P6806]